MFQMTKLNRSEMIPTEQRTVFKEALMFSNMASNLSFRNFQ